MSPRPPAPLRGLLDAASALRSEPDLQSTLQAMARSIGEELGFATVAINLYRPAWDDFEVVVVHGGRDAREALIGTSATAAEWLPLMHERYRRGAAYHVPHGSFDADQDFGACYIPDAEPLDHPDAWHPEDSLFLPLRASDGALLGVLSVDEPDNGLRPSDHALEVLGAVAAQAGLAVESAQRAANAARQSAAVEHLLRVSAHLVEERSMAEIFDAVCTGVRDALGFEKAAVFLRDAEAGCYVPRAGAGWSRQAFEALPPLALADAATVFDPARERDGCILLTREQAHRLVPPALRRLYASRRNGRGPHAWNNHWLIVPLHDREGELFGVLWVDDPLDRLKPSRERLQTLRTFANQATSALEMARRLERLRHLADHDPLTGLRNRRDLTEHIDARIAAAGPAGAALVVFDVDSFKRINDALGYEAGDRVLQALGAAIARATPHDGLAARLGGEEFAMLLPGADETCALSAAEALRASVLDAVSELPWGLTLSAGVSATCAGAPGADALLRGAGRALFAAKRLGRDRCVVYHPEALEELLGTLQDGSGSAEQVAAMILLAETLDWRDPGTARHSQTVGRYAESVARALEWSAERVERMRIAGVLHDIGKLGVSDAVLHKPGKLTDDEWGEIKRHSELGARILDHANLRDVSAWVLAHHERLDGRGYPNGLAGDAIPVEARILAVADAYEAMIADRPYRRGMAPADAQAELLRHAGTQFDPAVVRRFIELIESERAAAASGSSQSAGNRLSGRR